MPDKSAADSFAGVAARGLGGAGGGDRGPVGPAAGRAGQGLGQRNGRIRSMSPSVKRLRGQEGTPVEPETVDPNRHRSSARPKPVVGTSDSNMTCGKMRSPPADIFVWGVHPDTTHEDIVNDLASSDIVIKESDITNLRMMPIFDHSR